VPVLTDEIADLEGNKVAPAPVNKALDKVVTALHLQQPASTVDACREAARVILAAWLGPKAAGKDLGKVADKGVPKHRQMIKNVVFIICRFHSRGKSAEHEKQACLGSHIRSLADGDAEASVHLIGLLLREIGWAAP